jgi:hypothetical protein
MKKATHQIRWREIKQGIKREEKREMKSEKKRGIMRRTKLDYTAF